MMSNMKEINLPNIYRVNIIESELGWGSKIDQIKYFASEQDAKLFVKDFNSLNAADTAPTWYMQAEYVGKVE